MLNQSQPQQEFFLYVSKQTTDPGQLQAERSGHEQEHLTYLEGRKQKWIRIPLAESLVVYAYGLDHNAHLELQN